MVVGYETVWGDKDLQHSRLAGHFNALEIYFLLLLHIFLIPNLTHEGHLLCDFLHFFLE